MEAATLGKMGDQKVGWEVGGEGGGGGGGVEGGKGDAVEVEPDPGGGWGGEGKDGMGEGCGGVDADESDGFGGGGEVGGAGEEAVPSGGRQAAGVELASANGNDGKDGGVQRGGESGVGGAIRGREIEDWLLGNGVGEKTFAGGNGENGDGEDNFYVETQAFHRFQM